MHFVPDEKTDALIRAEILFFFPRIPKECLDRIIKTSRHSLMYKKAIYTRGLKLTTAYIRHEKTSYDGIATFDRELGRSVCQNRIRRIQDEWGFKKGRKFGRKQRQKLVEEIYG